MIFLFRKIKIMIIRSALVNIGRVRNFLIYFKAMFINLVFQSFPGFAIIIRLAKRTRNWTNTTAILCRNRLSVFTWWRVMLHCFNLKHLLHASEFCASDVVFNCNFISIQYQFMVLYVAIFLIIIYNFGELYWKFLISKGLQNVMYLFSKFF